MSVVVLLYLAPLYAAENLELANMSAWTLKSGVSPGFIMMTIDDDGGGNHLQTMNFFNYCILYMLPVWYNKNKSTCIIIKINVIYIVHDHSHTLSQTCCLFCLNENRKRGWMASDLCGVPGCECGYYWEAPLNGEN